MKRIALFVVAAMAAGCAQSAPLVPSGSPTNAAAVATGAPASTRHNGVPFVPSLGGGIYMYTADYKVKNPPLLGEITNGAQRVVSVWVDGRGTLYAANEGGRSGSFISEYKRGTTTPFLTIRNGLGVPSYVAVDSHHTLYVDENVNDVGTVLVYPKGSTSPAQSIVLPDPGYALEPGSMGFDRSGNLIIGTTLPEHNVSHVFRVQPGTWTVTDLGLQALPGNSVGLDAFENIYVTGSGAGVINLYPFNAQFSTRHISAQGEIYGIAVTSKGAIYAPSYNPAQVYEYEPGATSPTNSFATPADALDAAVGEGW